MASLSDIIRGYIFSDDDHVEVCQMFDGAVQKERNSCGLWLMAGIIAFLRNEELPSSFLDVVALLQVTVDQCKPGTLEGDEFSRLPKPCPYLPPHIMAADNSDIASGQSLASTTEEDNDTIGDAIEMLEQLGAGVPNKGLFLDGNAVLVTLITGSAQLNVIPRGLKENVRFIVDNADNKQCRGTGVKRRFVRDFGSWAGNSEKTYYYEKRSYSFVYIEKKTKGTFYELANRVRCPLKPQPAEDSLIKVCILN